MLLPAKDDALHSNAVFLACTSQVYLPSTQTLTSLRDLALWIYKNYKMA